MNRSKQLRKAIPAILPSMLQCDFGNLASEVARLEAAGAGGLHLDVMDGRFVPNLTYGMPIVEAIRRNTTLPLDIHLMIEDPGRYISAFVDAGANSISFHIEAVAEPTDLLRQVRSLGVWAGLAINPDTDLATVLPFVELVDFILVMSVPAGFGGQPFNSIALEKLRQLRAIRRDLVLEVDGGVNGSTIGDCREAGADLFVVGSALFRDTDYRAALDRLMQAMSRPS